MDFTLRCNDLKCRSRLDDRAVVTTCAHIFCIPCSESLGLASSDINTRTCPACHAQLPHPDDATITHLNPTEDYKTSVLSGLSPTTIMECAGRALNFFSYQTMQEMYVESKLSWPRGLIFLQHLSGDACPQLDGQIHDSQLADG